MPDANSPGRREADARRKQRGREQRDSWSPTGGAPVPPRRNGVVRRTPGRGGILRAIFGNKSNGKRR